MKLVLCSATAMQLLSTPYCTSFRPFFLEGISRRDMTNDEQLQPLGKQKRGAVRSTLLR